ncbi:MAG: GIY-YIG nuclease family protein [Cellulosilyticaceae bacterium]
MVNLTLLPMEMFMLLPTFELIVKEGVRVPLKLKPLVVYFLTYEGELVYIGKTNNIFNRLSAHILEGKKKFDDYCIAIFDTDSDNLTHIERIYIEKYLPMYNKRVYKSKFTDFQFTDAVEEFTK